MPAASAEPSHSAETCTTCYSSSPGIRLGWLASLSELGTLGLCLALGVSSLAGCGAHMPAAASPRTPPPGVAGNWELAAKSTGNAPFNGMTTPLGLYLTAGNDGALSGILFLQEPVPQLCTPTCCGVPFSNVNSSVSGTIDASGNLALQSLKTSAGGALTLNAQVSNATLQNGSYSISGGCADKGTVAGSKIPSLNGTYSGNVKSSITGDSFAVAITFSQMTQTPDARGFLHFNASAKFTGSSCLSTAAVEGSLATNTGFIGSVWQAELLPPGGPPPYIATGGTLAPDGDTLTFSYALTGGNCNGDAGNGTLTLQ